MAGTACGRTSRYRTSDRCGSGKAERQRGSPRRSHGTSELSCRLLEDSVTGSWVPALFRHQHSGRHADGKPRSLRGYAFLDPRLAAPRRSRRRPDRSSRRTAGTPRLFQASSRCNARRLDCRRENSGTGRATPAGLASRRHDGLRFPECVGWGVYGALLGRNAHAPLPRVHLRYRALSRRQLTRRSNWSFGTCSAAMSIA